MPYTPVPPPVWPRKSQAGLALGLSIAGFFCCGLLSIAGLVMGRQDMNAIDRGETDPSQRGLAQAAFVVGLIVVLLMLMVLVFYLVVAVAVVDSSGGGLR